MVGNWARAIIKYLKMIRTLLCLVPTLALAQAPEEGTAVDLDLDALRWKNRVLVLFSHSEFDPSFRLQKQDLGANAEGALDRDLMILDILENGQSRAGNSPLSGKTVEKIRATLGAKSGSFEVYLIGKDGGVKLRSPEPVPAKDIFRLIDSMPMRRQEMDNQRE